MQSCTSKSSSADARGGCSRHEDDGFTIGAQRGAVSQLQRHLFHGEGGVDQSSTRRSDVRLDEHQYDGSFGRPRGQRRLSVQDKEAEGDDSSTGSSDAGDDVAYGMEESARSQSRKSMRERQTGSGQQLLRRGVGSGTSKDVRESSGALPSPDQVSSGSRSDIAVVRHTYSPAF